MRPSDSVRIEVRGICAQGYHGVLETERINGQPFSVDVVAWVPTPTDELASTVSYSAMAQVAARHITGSAVNLIETLAGNIAAELMTTWPGLIRVAVTVHKPEAPIGLPFQDITCRVVKGRRQIPVRPFVLSLGANLGTPIIALRQAVQLLADSTGLVITASSDVYRTTPVEVTDGQPDYYNLVLVGHTALSPLRLLAVTSEIEQRLGRTRETHHGARQMDIDIIKLGDVALQSPALTLPHPGATHRAFVLVPWLQIDQGAELPAGPVAELLKMIDTTGVTRLFVET